MKAKRISWKEIKRQKFLMICTACFVVYGIIFYYLPLAGWIMAFQNYKPKDGFLGSPGKVPVSFFRCNLPSSNP